MRLLLRFLRERGNTMVSANELYSQYHATERKKQRQDYCGYDFRFRDFPHFQAALYSLDEEDKIRYAGGDEIVFKRLEDVRDDLLDRTSMTLSEDDSQQILTTLTQGFNDQDARDWDLKNVVRVAHQVCPDEVQAFLREQLRSDEWAPRAKAISTMEVVLSRE